MQLSHHIDGNVVALVPQRSIAPALLNKINGPFSAAVMAAHLRETHPDSAYCFALEMHEQAAWANAAWGEFWADVARLI